MLFVVRIGAALLPHLITLEFLLLDSLTYQKKNQEEGLAGLQ